MNRGNAGKGRPKGAKNRLSQAFKEATMLVFEEIGGTSAFADWARRHPTDFYKICARLIPHEVAGPGSGGEHAMTTTVIHQHLP
jgi:hypothetical protein